MLSEFVCWIIPAAYCTWHYTVGSMDFLKRKIYCNEDVAVALLLPGIIFFFYVESYPVEYYFQEGHSELTLAFAVAEICSSKLISCQQEAVNQDILQISNSLEIGCVIHVRADIYPCYGFFFSCFPPAKDHSFQTPRLSLILQEIRSRSALTLGHAENGGFLQMCRFKH